MRQVAVRERALVDLVADQLGVASADEIGDHIRADGRDEDHENRAHHAALDARQEDLAKGEEAARAEVARGLEEREVELLGRRVDRHDRERQERIDAHDQDRAGVVVERRLRVRKAQRHEDVLQEAFRIQKRAPGEHAHDEAGPERQHDQPRHDGAPAPVHPGDRIRARQRQQDAGGRGDGGNPDGAPHDLLVGRAHHGLPRLHREARRKTAVRGRRMERDGKHDQRGHDEEDRQPRERRQGDAPFRPARGARHGSAGPFDAGGSWMSDMSSGEKFSTM